MALAAVIGLVAFGPTFAGFSATTSNNGNSFSAGFWDTAEVVMDNPGAVLSGSVGLSATASTTDGSTIASVTVQRRASGTTTWTDVCTDTTSPYSCTFNTAAIPDGLYDFRATAATSAGGTGSSTAVTDRRVDNSAPTVTMTDPGAWFGRTTTLSSTSSDGAGTGVSSVRYQYKLSSGTTWTDACTGATAPFSCSFDASTLTEGDYYDFRAIATDGANFSTTSATVASRRLDKTAPTVTMSDPGANLRGTITLNASASDDKFGSGVASVRIQYAPAGAGTWVDACTDTTSPYSCSLNTTTLPDGLYDFRAIARDGAGNDTTSVVVASRRVDNTRPDVTLDDPGGYLRGIFTLTGSASDSGAGMYYVVFQYRVSGGTTWSNLCTDTTVPYSCTIDGSGANGVYDFRLVAVDLAGNARASNVVTTTIDNIAPSATMTDPGANLGGTAALAATASDSASGIASVVIQRAPAGGTTWTDVCTDTTSPYSCSFDTATVPDGLYDFRAVARDGAGNQTTSAIVANRRIDNTAPTAAMSDPGEWFGATKTLSSTSADAGSGVASVRYRYKLWSDVFWTDACTGGSAPFSCEFNVATLTDGATYDFQAVAVDAAGNPGASLTLTRVVRVDTQAPTGVTMTDPGTLLSGTLALSGTASDTPSGVASVSFQLAPASTSNWSTACSTTTSPYSCSFSTASVGDGTYDLRMRATDHAGNSTVSTVYAGRLIDNSAPTVTLTDPGANLRGTLSLDATAGDGAGAGVTSVVIQRSPTGTASWTDVCTDTSSPYSCSLDTTTLADGLYDFRAIATDGTGKQSTATVASRRIDNAPPTAAMSDPGAYVTGTVALAATAADNAGGSGVGSVALQRSAAGADTWTTICTVSASPYQCSWNTTLVADGRYDLRAVATDLAGNRANSSLVTTKVDNSAPAALGIQTANGGATAGVAEPGDTITFTYSEEMKPASFLAAWDGSSIAITVRLAKNTAGDQIQIFDSADTTKIPLANPLDLGASYTTGANPRFNATMVKTGSEIVVTLGTLKSGSVNTSVAAAGTMKWTTANGPTDMVGMALPVVTVNESGALDAEF